MLLSLGKVWNNVLSSCKRHVQSSDHEPVSRDYPLVSITEYCRPAIRAKIGRILTERLFLFVEILVPAGSRKITYNQTVEEITISIGTCRDTGMLIASWDDPTGLGGLTTQADNLTDLEANLREAVAVHFDPEELPKLVRLHFIDDPVLAAA